MKRSIVWLSLAIAVLVCGMLAGPVLAAESASKEECVQKCKEAVAVMQEKGIDAAVKQINDPKGPFVWKDSYVFCVDLDSVSNIAHPFNQTSLGMSLLMIKDSNGKMFYSEFVKIAKKNGEGWVTYLWPKPGESTPSTKNAYIIRVPETSYAMVAGTYE